MNKELPGDVICIPREALGEIAWYKVAFRFGYAFCFGAGVGVVIFLATSIYQGLCTIPFNF
jgi:hypothetical protein